MVQSTFTFLTLHCYLLLHLNLRDLGVKKVFLKHSQMSKCPLDISKATHFQGGRSDVMRPAEPPRVTGKLSGLQFSHLQNVSPDQLPRAIVRTGWSDICKAVRTVR